MHCSFLISNHEIVWVFYNHLDFLTPVAPKLTQLGPPLEFFLKWFFYYHFTLLFSFCATFNQSVFYTLNNALRYVSFIHSIHAPFVMALCPTRERPPFRKPLHSNNTRFSLYAQYQTFKKNYFTIIWNKTVINWFNPQIETLEHRISSCFKISATIFYLGGCIAQYYLQKNIHSSTDTWVVCSVWHHPVKQMLLILSSTR